jgi:hypothetical protein
VIKRHPSNLFLQTFAYFTHDGLAQRVGVDPTELLKFLVKVRRNYNQVPYHNWFHALDVIHFCYSCIVRCKMADFLQPHELFALLLSAICHDTDHDGFNNNFHRNAKTVLEHLSLGSAPLEHHHCCTSIFIVNKVFKKLNIEVRENISHFMIECIMATDMEKHKHFVQNFTDIQTSGFDKENSEHRLTLAQIVLKAADLGNVIRDFDEASRVAKCLVKECFRQGDKEMELGLPISPMCGRSNAAPLCVGQIGFYKYVAGPLMKLLAGFFPAFAEDVAQMERNLAIWEAQKKELEEES